MTRGQREAWIHQGALSRDSGAGQGAGECGILGIVVGEAAGGERGWMRGAGRDGAGREGPRDSAGLWCGDGELS